MKQIIDAKLYDTEKSNLVAHDKYWDGSNFDRQGRNKSLYKTPNGRFFILRETRWQGERDFIYPLDKKEAEAVYETLPEHEMSYEDAFGKSPEEA